MGTRCMTVVRERWSEQNDWQDLATIYRHWDGYPTGQGQTLLEFLDAPEGGEIKLVNGIGGDMPNRYANGAGSLAAQLIAHMQAGGHNPTLLPHGSVSGQEWTYVVLCDMESHSIQVEVFSGPVTFFGIGGEHCDRPEFSGTVAEYKKWIESQE